MKKTIIAGLFFGVVMSLTSNASYAQQNFFLKEQPRDTEEAEKTVQEPGISITPPESAGLGEENIVKDAINSDAVILPPAPEANADQGLPQPLDTAFPQPSLPSFPKLTIPAFPGNFFQKLAGAPRVAAENSNPLLSEELKQFLPADENTTEPDLEIAAKIKGDSNPDTDPNFAFDLDSAPQLDQEPVIAAETIPVGPQPIETSTLPFESIPVGPQPIEPSNILLESTPVKTEHITSNLPYETIPVGPSVIEAKPVVEVVPVSPVYPQPAWKLGYEGQFIVDYGMRVLGTENGSPADRAGLEAGDIIVRINQHSIGNPERYNEVLAEAANYYDGRLTMIVRIGSGHSYDEAPHYVTVTTWLPGYETTHCPFKAGSASSCQRNAYSH